MFNQSVISGIVEKQVGLWLSVTRDAYPCSEVKYPQLLFYSEEEMLGRVFGHSLVPDRQLGTLIL